MPEEIEKLFQWLYLNNMYLQAIIHRLYGEDAEFVMKTCIKETEKEFEKARKKGKRK